MADGAAIGRPVSRSKACATGWAGTRTATVSSPALASSDNPLPARRGSTRVSGPGQKRAASLPARRRIRERLRLGQTRHMDDQRVEARPALGGENLGDGAFVCRIAAEPVYGLGRKGDEPAGAQQRGGAGDRLGCGR